MACSAFAAIRTTLLQRPILTHVPFFRAICFGHLRASIKYGRRRWLASLVSGEDGREERDLRGAPSSSAEVQAGTELGKPNRDVSKLFDEVVEGWMEEKETPKERRERLEREEMERKLAALTALPDELVIAREADKCPGCGCSLQSESEERPGFVPMEVWDKYREQVQLARDWELRGRASVPAAEGGVAVEGEEGEGKASAENGELGSETTVQNDVAAAEYPKPVVCQRCFRLSNYGSISDCLRVMDPRASSRLISEPSRETEESVIDDTDKILTPDMFKRNLAPLRSKQLVIIYLVDVFDFHGTFLEDLRDLIGRRSPVILAINKVDLLPRDYKAERVIRWARREAGELGLKDVKYVHLVSSTKGTGVKELLSDAVDLARRLHSDIYVVGAANVGKSSFINRVLNQKGKSGDRKKERRKNKSSPQKGARKSLLTTSVIPGTTLDMIKIPLMSKPKMALYDTPGLILSHQLTNLLTAEELRAVLPMRSINQVTFRLGEGKSLYLGALARIDILEGRPFFFSTYVSSEVKVHPGRLSYGFRRAKDNPSDSEERGADDFTRDHVGGLLKPPFSQARYDALGRWMSKTCIVDGAGWKRAVVDIVFSGLGWVSITGVGSVKLRVCVPRGVGVFTREALMPFEIEKGVSKYTGSAAVNKKQEIKTRRKRKRQSERELENLIW